MTKRLYYNDPFLTQFDAVVTDIQELSRSNGAVLWRLALDRTAFYPTSGGQPHDTGRLMARTNSGVELVASVLGVEEDGQGHIWHHTNKPLQIGTAVQGEIDWPRRLDHMQQHSGQHLLSAAFARVCGAATVSFHLGEAVSTIDLATETLAPETLLSVAELANQIIAEDRPVTIGTVTREQAAAWLAAGEMRKLPEREGDVRIITIADFDRNACGGTHVRSTGQIGGLLVRGTEKVRQGVRVGFVCGLRAMRTARSDFELLTASGRALSLAAAEVPAAVARLQEQNKQAAKERAAFFQRMAAYQATEMLRQTGDGGHRFVCQTLAPPDAPDASYVKVLASKIASEDAQAVALLGWSPAPGAEIPASVFLACGGAADMDCAALLKQAMDAHRGRGGGTKTMAQGTIAPAALAAVLETLSSACH